MAKFIGKKLVPNTRPRSSFAFMEVDEVLWEGTREECEKMKFAYGASTDGPLESAGFTAAARQMRVWMGNRFSGMPAFNKTRVED